MLGDCSRGIRRLSLLGNEFIRKGPSVLFLPLPREIVSVKFAGRVDDEPDVSEVFLLLVRVDCFCESCRLSKSNFLLIFLPHVKTAIKWERNGKTLEFSFFN